MKKEAVLVRESVYRDIRPTMKPLVLWKTIFEAYTPTDSHMMREYMLYVVLKNVRRMRKHKLITESIYDKFKLLEN